MTKILIKNGRVIDPANKVDEACDILVENAKIAKVSRNITGNAATVIDANGKIVMPGLVDIHVHLREPGREDKETIQSGTAAALKGGVTTLLAMPNTQPAIDSLQNIELLKSLIKKSAQANVLICASITKERLGKELTDIKALKKSGALAISDDGSSVDDADLFLKALKIAKAEKILMLCHCEDKSLSQQGVVNAGIIATRLGLRGMPKAAEYLRIERDLKLAEQAKAPIHITHVSCRESVEMIAQAKARGVQVTADATPHHFMLSEEAVLGYDTNMKMNPPLRSKQDIAALKQGLKNNTLDAIASDHAPHTENEKDIEFDRAEFGVIGLETQLSVGITELVSEGVLSWPQLVEKLSLNPARILGVDKGTLGVGKDADIAIVSADAEWIVKKENLVSKSKNCAFLGRKLKGLVEYTIYAGEIVYKNGIYC